MEFRVPRCKIRDLSRQVHRTVADNAAGRLSLRRFASLIGKFNAVRGAVQSAPLQIWPLLHLQKSVLARSRSWDDILSLSSRVLEELTWWAQELKNWNGRSVVPCKTSITVTTDASHWGWGGFWKKTGQRAHPRDEARGFFSVRESKNSSNWRELTAYQQSSGEGHQRTGNHYPGSPSVALETMVAAPDSTQDRQTLHSRQSSSPRRMQ